MNPQQRFRRGTILAAATEVFAEHGYGAATMDRIALCARVSKGNLYNYFTGKRALFETLLHDRVNTARWMRPELAESSLSACEKLRELVGDMLREAGSSHMGTLLLDYWATTARESQDGSLIACIVGTFDRYRRVLASVLGEGVREGQIRDTAAPAVLASFVQTTVAGFIMVRVLAGRSCCTQCELDEFTDCLVCNMSTDRHS